MNVLLINPATGFYLREPSVPLGLLSIATYLKERGYKVHLYDRCVEKVSLEEVVSAFQPDVVGMSVISIRSIHDGLVTSHLFRERGIPIVWGGQTASVVPELVFQEDGADYVVFSEGEVTFYELLRALEKKESVTHIKGLAYLDETGTMQRTPDREFADLADFPVIDWSFIDPRKYFGRFLNCSKMMYLYNAKGCPWQCAFCFNKDYNRCIYRKRPNEYVINEIVELVTKYGLNGVYFADEMFGVKKKDLYAFCDRIRELKLDFVWGCQTRIGHFSREDLQYMYDSNCRWIYFGVESGSEEMLNRIHKGIDFAKIDEDFQNCREIGITTLGGFIIGFPDETEEQLRDTVYMALRTDANLCLIQIFTALPGTELYDYVVEKGMLTPPKTLTEWGKYPLGDESAANNYSQVPARDLYVIQNFFTWRSFLRRDSMNGAGSFIFAWNTITIAMNHIFKHGFTHGVSSIFSSAKRFFTVVWYSFAYPSVRKKYGLYKKNLGKKL